MSKRRLFIADENSPQLNCSRVAPSSPLAGGIHPASLTSTNSKKVLTDPKTSAKPVSKIPNVPKKKSAPDIPIVSNSDSESDSMEESSFFSKSSLKLPYTKEEDEIILKYVLKGENIYKATSISLWKYLEAKKEKPKRTYQSLKNRFLRNIKPFLFTKFRNFIEDKETMQKIITRFPELKQQVGRKETLTNIKLPERKPPSKTHEEERVSSTSTNECQGNTERAKALQTPEPDPEPDPIVHPKVQPKKLLKTSSSNTQKTEIYERTVNIESDGISVLVNFKAKKLVSIPTAGIYEKFKKLQEQNELILCPTCGQYNLPEVSPVKSTAESDVIISNSVNTQKDCRINLNSQSKTNKAQKQKRGCGSNLSRRSPCSPSLISEVGEGSDLDQPPRKRAASTIQIPQVPEVSNSASSRTVANDVTSVNGPSLVQSGKEIPDTRTRSRATKTSNSSSNTKAKNSKKASSSKSNSVSSSSKQLQDSDEDGDSLFEEAVANFRKLINSKEERILLGKCLKKAIGLEGATQNLDSCIFESSSDLETPPLTIDYETDSQNTNNDTEFESTSGSILAENMKKMFNEIKPQSKKS